MREKLRDGHARDRRMQVVYVVTGRVVELELALFAQLHDAGGGEAFGVRSNPEAMTRRERFTGRQIGRAKGPFEHDLLAVCDRDDAAGLLRGALHLEFE